MTGHSSSLPDRHVGLGVIGAGNFARTVLLHRFKTHNQVKLQGVVSAKGMSAKAVCEQFGFGYCSESVDALIADDGINSVLIATRHNLHGPLVHKVLAAGKHVFVEKPLCLDCEDLGQIAQCYEKCVKSGKTPVLAVGFNRRFSPLIQRIRSVLENRSTPLIACYRVNAGFIAKDSWVQDPIVGGGRIIGEVCHFVDTLRFLVGSPVRTVQAACIQTDDVRLCNRDSIAVTLTYHEGSVATIVYHALGNPDFPKEKLEISADGEVIVLEDFCKLEIFGRRKERIKARQDKGFDAEIAAFVNAVVNGGPAPIPFCEILETTEITFAINKALDTGQVIYPDKRNS